MNKHAIDRRELIRLGGMAAAAGATIANFTHEYFKRFAVTLDYLGMSLYVTPAVPGHR